MLITESDPAALNAAAARVLDTALEAGVNTVGAVDFFKADPLPLKRQAMAEAVEAAIANARAYAGGADVEVAGVLVIDGGAQHSNSQYSQQGSFGGRRGSFDNVQTSFIAGEFNVTSKVRVTCRIR